MYMYGERIKCIQRERKKKRELSTSLTEAKLNSFPSKPKFQVPRSVDRFKFPSNRNHFFSFGCMRAGNWSIDSVRASICQIKGCNENANYIDALSIVHRMLANCLGTLEMYY